MKFSHNAAAAAAAATIYRYFVGFFLTQEKFERKFLLIFPVRFGKCLLKHVSEIALSIYTFCFR